MTNKELLREKLFSAHVCDLNEVIQEQLDLFCCPICRKLFDKTDLQNKELTVGYIWPKELRKKSKGNLIRQHHVLLCKRCNNMAGTRGDTQVQLLEKIIS